MTLFKVSFSYLIPCALCFQNKITNFPDSAPTSTLFRNKMNNLLNFISSIRWAQCRQCHRPDR